MKRMRIRRKRRNYDPVRVRRSTVPLAWIVMAAGYLAGCVFGVFVAIKADSAPVAPLWSESVDKTGDLLSALCGYGTYGVAMLLLSTSFLGFLLIPGVLSIRGFLSGSVFTACLKANASQGLFQACLDLMLPGMFLLPALLILGQICMRWSTQLYRCRFGGANPPEAAVSRSLGAVLIFLLLASAVKAYFVPYLSARL